jgi:hypothetical protein
MGKTRTRSTSAGVTLDAGALIALDKTLDKTLDKGDRRMIALLQETLARGTGLRIPSGVVGQVWRDGRRQVALARLLRAREVEIMPLDGPLSGACGELCGIAGTHDVRSVPRNLVA